VNVSDPAGGYYANREFLIQQEQEMFRRCAELPGWYLNLGCGPRILKGFVNIDKYHEDPLVLNNDITDLPNINNGAIDLIFSAHSLEHVRHRLTMRTLRRWEQVLRPGGELWLSMPDLDECCRQLITTRDPKLRKWLKCTIFGYQGPEGCPDECEDDNPGQYHLAGYNKDEMEEMLWSLNIRPEWSYHYDGYGSPSFFILGRKDHKIPWGGKIELATTG
jgi:SAM-dependent methyltransferase